MRFHAILRLSGKTATGIAVPPEIVEQLGAGKRPAVKVTLNEYTYRTTVAPLGGEYLVPVSAEIREQAHVAAGDELDVDIELDTAPREVEVPPDLASALASDATARRAFDALSYSNRKAMVASVEQAKSAETRQRRIDKALSSLREDHS